MRTRPRTRPGGRRFVALVALWVAAGGVSAVPASAADLDADFHFNQTRTAPTGQAISDIGTGNAFGSEAVDAGPNRSVLQFPSGNGLSLPTTGLASSGSYSVVMLFRLDSIPGRRKLLDFGGGGSDAGVYLCNGQAQIDLLGSAPCLADPEAAAGWLQVAVTRDGETGSVQAYLGADTQSISDVSGAFALPEALRFFRDDDQPPGDEQSGGAVARIRVYDGVLSAEEVAALDRVDSTSPAVTLGPVPGVTADSTPALSGSAGTEAGDLDDVTVALYSGSTAGGTPVETVTTTRNGGSWAVTAPALADGTYTAQAEQGDGAGNTGKSGTSTFRVDTTAPSVSVSSPAAGSRTGDSTPTYGGAASAGTGDGGTVTVNVYSGSAPTGSPVQTLTATRSGTSWSVTGSTPLPDGTYTIRASQSDTAGNTGDSTPVTFTVDTAAPAPSVTAPAPGSRTNDATPHYAGGAGDAAGDASTVSVRVYSGPTASGTPVQTLSATRSGTTWSVDGSSALPDGVYTAEARQSDSAGNTGTSDPVTFTVDTTAPAPSISSPPDGATTGDATPHYVGGAGDAPGDSGTITVRVYAGTAASGTPLQTLTATRSGSSWSVDGTTALADGVYTAVARQSDSAGNAGESGPVTFTVDTGAPAPSITAPGSGSATNDATPRFSGGAGSAAGDSATVTVRIYPGSAASGQPIQTLSATRSGSSWTVDAPAALADGAYTAQASQSDGAGNTGTSDPVTFTVDTGAPAPSLASPAAGSTTNDPTPVYSGQAGSAPGDAATVTVRVFTGSAASGTPLQTLTATRSGSSWSVDGVTALADGVYTARAQQGDTAGNTGLSAPVTFTVDTVAAGVSISSPGPGLATNDSTPTYSGAGGDDPGDADTVTVSVFKGGSPSGDALQTLTAPRSGNSWSVTGTTPLEDGVYTVRARQRDIAGNVNDSNPVTFTVDTAPPDTNVVGGPGGPTNDPTADLGFASADATSFVCRLYLAGQPPPPFAGCASPYVTQPLGDGAYVFEVAGLDAAGNQDGSPASRAFRVDTKAPRTQITVGPGLTTSAADAAFTFSADEPASFSCRLDDGAWQQCASPQAYSGLAPGAHHFEVRAVDAAGNQEGAGASHAWQVLAPGLAVPAVGKQAVALARELVQMRRTIKRTSLRRLAKRGELTFPQFDAMTPGIISLRVTTRRVKFAAARWQIPEAGRYSLDVKLTRRGKRLARTRARLPVKLAVTFTDRAGRNLQANTTATMLRRLPTIRRG